MNLRGFLRAGHWPTLVSAFLYFDMSFMVWVLIGALAPAIATEYALTPAERGLLVAVPILAGAALRLLMGPLADRIGGRRTGMIGLGVTLIPLLLGWLWAGSFNEMLIVGALLGVAGASFAVALPLASRWYPPRYQGLAMGIAGAGNSGTALATLLAPRLAASWGWHAVFGLAAIAILGTLLVFSLLSKDHPSSTPTLSSGGYGRLLRMGDTWWLCLFYGVTFGGFVGLASFLSTFFHDQYAVTAVEAGNLATLCVIAGSFLRPVGGHLADRFGGVRVLMTLFILVASVMSAVAFLPPLAWATTTLFLGMALLGMGNGAVFQLVPQRFPQQIGMITGLVGAAGGVGGFFLPNLLGIVKQTLGSFGPGFAALALAAVATAIVLALIARVWGDAAEEEPAVA